MREIKFRAWNGKEMFYPETENNSDTFNSGFNAGRVEIRDYTTGIEDNLCIPMQYTGLKDKNGKEIYEGDIIKYENPEYSEVKGNNPFLLCDVKFEGGSYCLNDYIMSDDIFEHYEVIGNIYENPELLTN